MNPVQTPALKPNDKETARSLISIGRAIQKELVRASKNADNHHLLGKEYEMSKDMQRFVFLGRIADAISKESEEQGYDMSELLDIKGEEDYAVFIR